MSLATGHNNVLPKLSALYPKYDFPMTILPSATVSIYPCAKEFFDSMPSALRVYFFKDTTFDASCTRILIKRQRNSTITCGFILLLRLFDAVYEHMGKIKNVIFAKGETYDSLITKS